MLFHVTEIKYQEPDHTKMCGDGQIEDLPGMHSHPFMRALYVRFKKGAYTKWHCHTGEQILIAIEGKGFVEFEGQPDIQIAVGDRVYVPAGLWHRHGALEGETLVHLAITTGDTQWRTDDPCAKHD